MTEEFKLNAGDLISPTWLKLKKHMEAQLQSLRVRNDYCTDEATTNQIRGEIRGVKNLLALSEKAPAMDEDDEQI